jgi:hypothetical protein
MSTTSVQPSPQQLMMQWHPHRALTAIIAIAMILIALGIFFYAYGITNLIEQFSRWRIHQNLLTVMLYLQYPDFTSLCSLK